MEAHRAQLLVDAWLLIPVLLAVNAALWMTDDRVFARIPGAAARMGEGRMQLLLLAVVGMGAITAWPRRAQEVAALAGLCVTAIVAATLAELGSPGASWFQFIYPFLLSPLLCYLSPWERLGLHGAQALVAVGFYFGTVPAHLEDPLAPALTLHMLFLLSMSWVYGVRLDRGRRRTFAMNSALREERGKLRSRVAEKSAALRAMVDRFDDAVLEDRVHLARELHDVSGQLLTAARLAMNLTVSRYAHAPLGIAPNLDQLRGLLDEMTEELRDVLDHLRPRELDELGLPAAIARIAARFQDRTGVEHRVEVDGRLPPVPQEVSLAAYRCVQEAVTNCAKHAHAHLVRVVVRVDAGALWVEVADDGAGLSRERGQGVGLVGMRERAETLGGSVEIAGRRGRGTTVRMRLPLGEEP